MSDPVPFSFFLIAAVSVPCLTERTIEFIREHRPSRLVEAHMEGDTLEGEGSIPKGIDSFRPAQIRMPVHLQHVSESFVNIPSNIQVSSL